MRTANMPWPHERANSRSYSRQDLVKLLAIVLPPVAVKMSGQPRSIPLNVLLTLCGWIPGVIHARRIVRNSFHVDYAAEQLVNALRNHVRR